MKKFLLLAITTLTLSITANSQEYVTFGNKTFSIDYPAEWEVTYDDNECLNLADADGNIRFDITFNQQGPMKNQLQECVDNWVYMKESHGHKVDQKLVKDDYALVRSIETNEDDGAQTVVVWFLMISSEPQCFSDTIQSDCEHANEAIDVLVKMLATLNPK